MAIETVITTTHSEQLGAQVRAALGKHNDNALPVVTCVAQLVQRVQRLESMVRAAAQDASTQRRVKNRYREELTMQRRGVVHR